MVETSKLGVGAIIAESFSILFHNFPLVIALGFCPAFATMAMDGWLLGWDYVFFGVTTGGIGVVWGGELVSTMSNFVGQALGTALLVQVAYDAKLGRRIKGWGYVKRVGSMLIPIVGVTLVVTVLLILGLIVLVVPGVIVYVVFSLVIPCIVIEGAGFQAMKRSAQLTEFYRWPIFGLLIVMWFFSVIFGIVGLAGAVLIVENLGYSTLNTLAALIVFSLGFAISIGVTAIAIALTYARLREMKEGVGVDDLAAVFE